MDTTSRRSFLEIVVILLGIFKSLLMAVVILFFSKMGYEGFLVGEMGIMIGLFMVVIVLVLIPVWVFTVIVSIKLFGRKRWALITSLIITVFYLLVSFFSLLALPSMLLPVLVFLIIMLSLEIRCLNSGVFQ